MALVMHRQFLSLSRVGLFRNLSLAPRMIYASPCIGAHGKNMRKSLYTEEVPPTPIGQATVVSGVAAHSSNLSLDRIAVPTGATSAANVTQLKTTRATDADVFSYGSANAGNKEMARASMLARCAAAIPVYNDTLAGHIYYYRAAGSYFLDTAVFTGPTAAACLLPASRRQAPRRLHAFGTPLTAERVRVVVLRIHWRGPS